MNPPNNAPAAGTSLPVGRPLAGNVVVVVVLVVVLVLVVLVDVVEVVVGCGGRFPGRAPAGVPALKTPNVAASPQTMSSTK
jgi:hypothetical protein